MHIFLLEDDDRVVESMSRALEMRQWLCTRAETLAEAQALLGGWFRQSYDCAVLDLNLPDGKGTDLLPLAEDFPVAVYSGLPEDAKLELARRDIDPDSVKIFSKGDPFGLFDWLEAIAK